MKKDNVQDIFYVQTQARRILKCLCRKDYKKANINSRYLNGINKTQFWDAFGELHSIFESYYTQAVKDPSHLSLPLYEIDKYKIMSTQAREGDIALLDFPKTLFAIGQSSKINKNVLTVNNTAFKQILKNMGSKKLAVQITQLSEYGFIFTQWNGKAFPVKCETFELEYPDNKNILSVLLAIGDRLKQYMQVETVNVNGLYKFERFVCLDPNLYAIDTCELPPKTLNYMLDVVGESYNDLLIKMVEKFEERDMELRFETVFLKNRFFNKKGKDTLNHIVFGDYREGRDGNECLFLRLKLNHPEEYIEKINKLPKRLKESFENVWCSNCVQKCNKRITYTLDGKVKNACGCHFFMFKDPTIKDLDILMELYDYEQEVRIKK
jgi:hypothetical protein